MKTREIIRGASYGPETLKVLFKAFDAAWDEIRPIVSQDAIAVQAARTTLAKAVLKVATEDSRDPDLLKEGALRLYRAKGGRRSRGVEQKRSRQPKWKDALSNC
jgi:hypothetical protein